jgi:nucleotide-binding universal stress UspA family protein
MKSILVATDGSKQADRAVVRAAELASISGATLTVLNVQDTRPLREIETRFAEIELAEHVKDYSIPPLANEGGPELSVRDAIVAYDRQSVALRQVFSDNILARAREMAKSASATSVTTLSANGDAATEIIAAAQTTKADLIVLGRRGLSGIAELFLGSVSQKVLHQARVDVLTIA